MCCNLQNFAEKIFADVTIKIQYVHNYYAWRKCWLLCLSLVRCCCWAVVVSVQALVDHRHEAYLPIHIRQQRQTKWYAKVFGWKYSFGKGHLPWKLNFPKWYFSMKYSRSTIIFNVWIFFREYCHCYQYVQHGRLHPEEGSRLTGGEPSSCQSFIAACTLVSIFSLSLSLFLSLPPSLSLSLLFSDDGLSPAEGVGVDDPRWWAALSSSVYCWSCIYICFVSKEVQTCPADKFRRTLSGMAYM